MSNRSLKVANVHRLPVVAVVGRPNVGKSTLFNRIGATRKAVVHDMPGMTRDRNYTKATWNGREFILIDTGGYELDLRQTIAKQVRMQTMMAVDEADVIIFLASEDEAMNPTDDEVVALLRKTRKPVFLAVNKCDNPRAQLSALAEFARFGTNQIFGVSALHGIGTGDLLDAVAEALPDFGPPPEEADLGIRVAIVGRPNAGKSTLLNRLLGYDRAVVSDVPGTTRDAVDVTLDRPEGRYTFIDTAGIRRRGKVKLGAEKLSVMSSFVSMERCDIAILMIDAVEGLTDQDAHIAGYAVDAGCALIIVVNKWDAIEKDHKTADKLTKQIHDDLGFVKFAPVLTMSAATGQRAEKIFPLLQKVYVEYTREIETAELNRLLKRATTYLSPPVRSGKQLKIKYVTQTGSKPPTFAFFVNDPALLHFSYERFLANQFREAYGFEGVPVRFRFRKKADDNPFVPKSGAGGKGAKKAPRGKKIDKNRGGN